MIKNTIEAICTVKLASRESQIRLELFELATLREWRILSSRGRSRSMEVAIPWKAFKLLYGQNPRIKKYASPNGGDWLIDSIEVTKIKAY